jgi:hypothetical protein
MNYQFIISAMLGVILALISLIYRELKQNLKEIRAQLKHTHSRDNIQDSAIAVLYKESFSSDMIARHGGPLPRVRDV